VGLKGWGWYGAVILLVVIAFGGVMVGERTGRESPASAAPRQGAGARPSEVPEPRGYVEPSPRETKPDVNQSYVFIWVAERDINALNGFPTSNPVKHAATYNEETRALYVVNPREQVTNKTQAIILTEVVTPEALLYSDLHMVSNLLWEFAFPDITLMGVVASGPDKGKLANMVANERREVRGPVTIQAVKPDGSVTFSFGGQTHTVAPGSPWYIMGAKQESQFVVYNFGRWNTRGITYAEAP
jgi:hypothetical protein